LLIIILHISYAIPQIRKSSLSDSLGLMLVLDCVARLCRLCTLVHHYRTYMVLLWILLGLAF